MHRMVTVLMAGDDNLLFVKTKKGGHLESRIHRSARYRALGGTARMKGKFVVGKPTPSPHMANGLTTTMHCTEFEIKGIDEDLRNITGLEWDTDFMSFTVSVHESNVEFRIPNGKLPGMICKVASGMHITVNKGEPRTDGYDMKITGEVRLHTDELNELRENMKHSGKTVAASLHVNWDDMVVSPTEGNPDDKESTARFEGFYEAKKKLLDDNERVAELLYDPRTGGTPGFEDLRATVQASQQTGTLPSPDELRTPAFNTEQRKRLYQALEAAQRSRLIYNGLADECMKDIAKAAEEAKGQKRKRGDDNSCVAPDGRALVLKGGISDNPEVIVIVPWP